MDASIGIVRRWFSERTGSDAMTRHAFRFGIVYILFESLNVALVGRQVDVFSADVTFSPSALVSRGMTYLGVRFVDVTTVRALFVGVTDGFDVERPTLQMVIVALIPKEFPMTQSA